MMWTIEDFTLSLIMFAVIGAILVLLVRAIYPNRVVIDEREDFNDYDTPETRFRKASGEDA